MRKLSTVAQCAKLVRKDLKKQYPSIKFSVKSENYSMGDSINVYYSDGLTDEQHTKLYNYLRENYQMGTFNGMEDIYEYTNRNTEQPQTQFIFLQRSN